MGFRYSVVSETLSFLGYDILENPREILAAIKEAGWDGVDMPSSVRVDPKVLMPLVMEAGLVVPEVLGAWAYFHAGEDRDLCSGDPAARERGISYARRAIDLCVGFGAHLFSVCAAQPPVPQLPFPDKPIRMLRKNFVDALKEICAYAAERGIVVPLEPLSCYEAFPGVLTTVQEAAMLINEAGIPNLGIQPDISHMNPNVASISDSLRAVGKHICHVHINETTRYDLGSGHADFQSIFRALLDVSYTGYLAVYMPHTTQEASQMGAMGYGSLEARKRGMTDRPDLLTYLKQTITHLKHIEQTVMLAR